MPGPRTPWLLPLAWLLGACGVAETTALPVATAPVPGEPPALLGEPIARQAPLPEPAPEPAPAPSAQERWSAPFAVQSSGRMTSRPPRATVVVRTEVTPVVSAPPELPAAAAPAGGTAPVAARGAGPEAPRGAARAERTARTRTHRVERGDTWYGIARQYDVAPGALRAANPQVDPDRIRIGQTLRIPRESGDSRSASARTHRVGRGDTLWAIAHRYGVSVEALRRANRLEGDRVRLGETLIIPGEAS